MSRRQRPRGAPRGAAAARFLSDLPPAMSRALVRCEQLVVPVRRGPSGSVLESTGICAATLRALDRHGLVEEATDKRLRTVWRPTARGTGLVAAEEPHLLAVRGDYTNDPALAVRDEPEAVAAGELDRITRDVRKLEDVHRAGVDERLVGGLADLRDQRHRLQQVAVQRGLDVRSELRMIDRAQVAIERKILDQRRRERAA